MANNLNQENEDKKDLEQKETKKKSTTKAKTTTTKSTTTQKKQSAKKSTTKTVASRQAKPKSTNIATKKTTNTTAKKGTTTKKASSTDKKKIEKAEDTKKSKKRDQRVKAIISEQINKINQLEEDKAEEEKREEVKKEEEKKKIEEKKLNEEEIAKKIEKSKKMPKEQKRDILKKVGINLLIALGVAVYFGFIMLGYINIERETYINDLKVFSLVVIALTIILFEQAYNKNNGKIAVYGVEALVVSVVTLIMLYTAILYSDYFVMLGSIIAAVILVYYTIKSIVILIRERKKWINSISDVKEIVSEEDE